MTEEISNPHYVKDSEAARCFCPLSMNKKGGAEFCYGTNCMAWRWAKLPDMTDDGKIRLDPVYTTTHGYCGMVRG